MLGAHGLREREPHETIYCTVELFGVAQLLTGVKEISLGLPAGATLSQLLTELTMQLPMLAGRVVNRDRARLLDGYACSVNGVELVRSASARINPGDRIIVLSADAGG